MATLIRIGVAISMVALVLDTRVGGHDPVRFAVLGHGQVGATLTDQFISIFTDTHQSLAAAHSPAVMKIFCQFHVKFREQE